MGVAVSTEASIDINKKDEQKEAAGDGGTVEVVTNPEAASAPSLEVASAMVTSAPTLQVTSGRSLEVSSERVVQVLSLFSYVHWWNKFGFPITIVSAVITFHLVELIEFCTIYIVLTFMQFNTPSVPDKRSDAANVVDLLDLIEEVNDTPEYEVEDERGSTLHTDEDEDEGANEEKDEDDNDDDDDGDGDDSDNPGEVSIKKKLWTFFTT